MSSKTTLRRRRNGSATSRFIAGGKRPEYVANFSDGFYAVDGVPSTFANALEFTTTGNRTMLDSTGVLKWSPHNLLTYSEDFSNAAWSKLASGAGVTPTVTSGFLDPAGGFSAFRLQASRSGSGFSLLQQQITATLGIKYNSDVWVKSNTGSNQTVYFRGASTGVTEVTTEWSKVSVSEEATSAAFYLSLGTRNTEPTADLSVDILIWGAHLYRSDLGGMADVPVDERVAGSTTYVPTTSAAKYLPRYPAYTYVSGVLTGPYIQLESEARTNLVTYSEDFANAAWTRSSITITADNATAPTGAQTADLFQHSSAAGQMTQDMAVTSGATATFSIFVKAKVTGYVRLVVSNTEGSNFWGAWFNTATGAFETTQSFGVGVFETSAVETFGDFYRISITGNVPATATYRTWVYLTDADNSTTRSTTPQVWFFGAQLEQASTPSSYIPTLSGSTVTRPAETLTAPWESLPWGAAVSIGLKGLVTYANLNQNNQMTLIERTSGTPLIQINLETDSGTGGVEFAQRTASGTSLVQTVSSYTPGNNVPFNIASRHGSTFINGAVDGTALTANLTPTALPALSTTDMQIGSTFNGFIEHVYVAAADVGDDGIETWSVSL